MTVSTKVRDLSDVVSLILLKPSHIKFNLYKLIYFLAPVTETCKHLGSHNAEKLNNSWIYFLGGLEDDRLGRNMSLRIYLCI